MPYEQNGVCPFKGMYWPERWPLEKKVTAKQFHKLHELQRRDLILSFYEQESAKAKQNPLPPYKFCLRNLKGYFGRGPENIRNAVLDSELRGT